LPFPFPIDSDEGGSAFEGWVVGNDKPVGAWVVKAVGLVVNGMVGSKLGSSEKPKCGELVVGTAVLMTGVVGGAVLMTGAVLGVRISGSTVGSPVVALSVGDRVSLGTGGYETIEGAREGARVWEGALDGAVVLFGVGAAETKLATNRL
jgi:hypothetical protein